MKSTILYAVRHGETEWNVSGIQQGHQDSPLTANGVRQAEALSRGLLNRSISYIYSSDLGRAARTAGIIAESLSLPVILDEGLRERNLGSMEGLTQTQFREKHPDEYERYRSYDPDYHFPGGESARERFERSVSTANTIIKQHPEEVVLIVAHGGVLNSLLTYTLELGVNSHRRFSLFNGAINRFSIVDDVWNLDTWGDLSHLSEIDSIDDF